MAVGTFEDTILTCDAPNIGVGGSAVTVMLIAPPPVQPTPGTGQSSQPGIYDTGIEVVAVGVVPRANNSINITVTLQELLPDGTIGSTRNVTVTASNANRPRVTMVTPPFRLSPGRGLGVTAVRSGASDTVTCDFTVWIRHSPAVLPEQRQTVGVSSI